MSKALGVILKAATFVASLVPGLNALVFVGLGVATLVNTLLMPRPKQQARQASIAALSIGEMPREAIFGEALVPGSICFSRTDV